MKSNPRLCAGILSFVSGAIGLLLPDHAVSAPLPKQPRIVNLYNFIRNSDYRVRDSENVLYETTRQQLELIKPTGLPTTWALQYDALINPRYQALLKEQAGPNDEIAAWWEIPRQLVEKAGLKWRGHAHDWDSTANIGFSPGYTPEDRRKLVDVYMADFKSVFGRYPETVGSWYIDEVTLDYLVKRYGIVASCNCKDQVGTDGYTLWGGYWNQAYYPSRLNAYMPAQTKTGQIDVPVFRMLGSDPIYQYAPRSGMFTLEPVYSESGASEAWVEWFMKNLIHQPSLAFAYTQAGQENSFGWDGMKKGLTMQVAMLEKQAKAGEIQVMTLAQAGKWFKQRFPVTPPTSMVYLDDWKNEGRKSIWYNSRFYRVNFLWQKDGFLIRDLHRFDEKVASVTHELPLTTSSLSYGTLALMDGARWSGQGQAGIMPVLISVDGKSSPMIPEGQPVVKETSATELGIVQPLRDGGSFRMDCRESSLAFTAVDGKGHPLRWAWDMTGGEQLKSLVTRITPEGISYRADGSEYGLKLAPSAGSCQKLDSGVLRLSADRSGNLVIQLERP